MCKYCKRLEEVRKNERHSYDVVLSHYKKELRKDDKLFRRCLRFMDCLHSELGSSFPLSFLSEYAALATKIEDLLDESEVKDDA